MKAPAAAALASVSVVYPTPSGPVHALDDVTVDFPEMTSTAVVGRSGSGKSTLVSVLALLRRPTAGQVQLRSVVTSALSSDAAAKVRAGGIGVVFQAFHLENSLTVWENVMLPWYFQTARTSRSLAHDRALELLAVLGIPELADRNPNEVSGGQRQRVAIARALFAQPTLLIADEPTGNLDEETANGVAETLFLLPLTVGTTVVVVTHDKAIADRAGRKISLIKGRVSDP